MPMTDWELIDDGSFNGVRKWIRSNEDDHGTVQVRYEGFDVPVILKRNHEARMENDGKRMGDGLEKAAEIPATVLYKWLVEDGVWAPDDPEYTKRKLNDPDWRYLKCRSIIL
jgi:hypothetical protein